MNTDFSAMGFNPDESRVGAKISSAEQLRVGTVLVIGGRHMESGAVRVRLHMEDLMARN
ncbi:MAG: His/Gly/Thr/Pro-type tRNA ligase C-terminal domain-containing protein [Verrucomicrobiota bacterium]